MPNETELADLKTIASLLSYHLGRQATLERAVEALCIAAVRVTDPLERAQIESIITDLQRDGQMLKRFLQRVKEL